MFVVALFVSAIFLRLFMEPPWGWQTYWLGLAVFFFPLQAWLLATSGRGRGAVGANDNASGVAVMLETARVFSKIKPDLELWFAAFGGEEQELVGSKGFVEKTPELRKRTWVLDLDMAGVGEPCIIAGSGTWRGGNSKLHRSSIARSERRSENVDVKLDQTGPPSRHMTISRLFGRGSQPQRLRLASPVRTG